MSSFRDIEEEIDQYLSKLWLLISIERPRNHKEIVDFCVEDVKYAADPDDWDNEDIEIAFRRFLEKKS